jgi:putative transposase
VREKRFTEEQGVRILQEAGMSARDVCRKHNVCEQSVYRWKAQDGGMGVRAVKRLRGRERAHAALKKSVAEQAFDMRMLKDVNAKKFCAFPSGDVLKGLLQDQ